MVNSFVGRKKKKEKVDLFSRFLNLSEAQLARCSRKKSREDTTVPSEVSPDTDSDDEPLDKKYRRKTAKRRTSIGGLFFSFFFVILSTFVIDFMFRRSFL